MALKITLGELKRKATFKRPNSSLNNEGGREITYTDAFTTNVKVEELNQRRATEADGTGIIGGMDFIALYSVDANRNMSLVTKEWLITYAGSDWTLHSEGERIDSNYSVNLDSGMFIRFTAKTKV